MYIFVIIKDKKIKYLFIYVFDLVKDILVFKFKKIERVKF